MRRKRQSPTITPGWGAAQQIGGWGCSDVGSPEDDSLGRMNKDRPLSANVSSRWTAPRPGAQVAGRVATGGRVPRAPKAQDLAGDMVSNDWCRGMACRSAYGRFRVPMSGSFLAVQC